MEKGQEGSSDFSKKEPIEEPEMCEACGDNPASIGIPQGDGTMFYICNNCYVERGIEDEDIEEVNQ